MSDNLQELREELEAAEAAEWAHPLPCSGQQAGARGRRVLMARAAYARALGVKANEDGKPRSANPYKPDALGTWGWGAHGAWDSGWYVQQRVREQWEDDNHARAVAWA